MIKLRTTDATGRIRLTFGLSAENIRRLQDGQPILFNLDEFGFESEVLIITGETEESMKDDLRKAGLKGI